MPTKPLVFANFLAPNLNSTYAAVAAAIGRTLGIAAELREGTSMTQLTDGTVDLAFLCGLPYVRLQAERPGLLTLLAAPVLSEPRCADRPVYFSDVVVRTDSPVQSFSDLRGRRWAHNAPDSFSGCLLTRYRLQTIGESEAFFGRVSFSGTHLTSLRQLLAGEIDASAIDSHVLGVALRDDPTLGRQLRVIASFGPSPIPPLVASERLPVGLRLAIRAALCALADEEVMGAILGRGLIRRFVAVGDRDYDGIRRTLAAVEPSERRGNLLAGRA